MKSFKNLSVIFFVLLLSSAFTLKNNDKVYVAGVSASFTDSIVFFTDIQAVDSVELDAHGFIPERAQYSYQLKTYLEEKEGLPNRVCFIYFSDDAAKLQKQMNKIREKYVKGKKSYVRDLKSDSFQFTKPVTE